MYKREMFFSLACMSSPGVCRQCVCLNWSKIVSMWQSILNMCMVAHVSVVVIKEETENNIVACQDEFCFCLNMSLNLQSVLQFSTMVEE